MLKQQKISLLILLLNQTIVIVVVREILKSLAIENNEAESIEKLREECIQLTEEYIKKKQEYDQQQEELRKEQERLEQLKLEAQENKEKNGNSNFQIIHF